MAFADSSTRWPFMALVERRQKSGLVGIIEKGAGLMLLGLPWRHRAWITALSALLASSCLRRPG